MDHDDLPSKLLSSCPTLKAQIETLAEAWLSPLLARLDTGAPPGFPKVFNDPIWGTIELMPWEVALLDSPLVQRLRGVRQLGLAHYVYPGAGHDRLEHIRGVVEAAERMISRLDRNADHRRNYGPEPDAAVPEVSKADRLICRLAALLHDIGHGPFSHAIEPLIEQRHEVEFAALRRDLIAAFDGAGSVSVSEAIAILLVLSPAMGKVFNHQRFSFPESKNGLAMRVAARIVGARSHLRASYLSGVVSGPIDADKLDYMARDSHHAGLPLGLDTNRLISKLEVIIITPDNAPPKSKELRARAESARDRRIYEMGISLSGIGAYEQMLVGRVLLYDRLYYHHKVRVGDAMAQRLVAVAEQERGRSFTIKELFCGVSDDTMIGLLGGILKMDGFDAGGHAAREIAQRILDRRFYHRALAFAVRFIPGMEGMREEERDNERGALWRQITKALSTLEDTTKLSSEMYDTALKLAEHIPELKPVATNLCPEHIIVDLPSNKAKPSGNLLLTRTEKDEVGLPNLFFDPERWSNAYDQQKRCGYVFCPWEARSLVALAAKVALFQKYRLVMGEAADRFTKTVGLVKSAWLDQLAKVGAIDAECYEQLRDERTPLSLILPEDIELPQEWLQEKPDLAKILAKDIAKNRPGGFTAAVKAEILGTLSALCRFLGNHFVHGEILRRDTIVEKDLQDALKRFLGAVDVPATEGAELTGGETDLILFKHMVVENKCVANVRNPLDNLPNAAYQARRYAMALCRSVVFTVVAYKPVDEATMLPPYEGVAVRRIKGVSGDCIEIRVAVPYGVSRPSDAKAVSGEERG